MIPLHLKLSGFLSYRDPVEVDFSAFHLACVSGANGAGKSSLLDAITWALFGQARKRDESLINLQSKAAEVTFIFAYEDNLYRVMRALPRGKSSVVEFHVAAGGEAGVPMALQAIEWRPLTERSGRDTQRSIERILRLDYETFVNVSFFLQGRADQFAQQPPARRKEILANILGLEIWEEYKERAAERRRESSSKLDMLDGRLQEIEAELAEEEPRKQRLKELTAQLEQLSATRQSQARALENLKKAAASQLAEKVARLEAEKNSLLTQERIAKEQADRLSGYGAQLEKAERLVSECAQKIEQRKSLESNRNELREQAAALQAENESLKSLMDELKERIDRLEAAEGATCPLCGQVLSEEHRLSTLEGLKGEGREKGDRFRSNRARLEELSRQIREQEAKLAALGNAEQERLEAARLISQLNERSETAKAQVKEWQEKGAPRLEEINAALASQEFAAGVVGTAEEVREAERLLDGLQEQENLKHQEVGEARQRVNVLVEQRKLKKKLAAEREALAMQVARYRTLERAFGKDGVPALLVEQALPEIEMKANELLDRLSDGSMSVRFVTQSAYKDRKRDDLRETLEIQISDGAGVRDYEMYSGGEAFRANFAIRLALSEVLASRKGARLQMLVIDEGFGSQDAQGRQRLLQSIRAVQGDFAKVLIITHLDELKDAFPNRIEVEKGEGGSFIRVL